MNEKELKNGKEYNYSSDECEMNANYGKSLSGQNYFKIDFNGKLWMYKTFNAFSKKVNYFINKYGLSIN